MRDELRDELDSLSSSPCRGDELKKEGGRQQARDEVGTSSGRARVVPFWRAFEVVFGLPVEAHELDQLGVTASCRLPRVAALDEGVDRLPDVLALARDVRFDLAFRQGLVAGCEVFADALNQEREPELVASVAAVGFERVGDRVAVRDELEDADVRTGQESRPVFVVARRVRPVSPRANGCTGWKPM